MGTSGESETFRFRAVFSLSKREVLEHYPIKGPLFENWMPKGPEDAISLPASGLSESVSFWFERRHKTDELALIYDFNLQPVTSDDFVLNSLCVDAGYLFAEFSTASLDEEQKVVVRHSLSGGRTTKPDESASLALCRKVWRTILPPTQSLCERIAFQFGQWWIEVPESWHPERESLRLVFYRHMVQVADQTSAWGALAPSDKDPPPSIEYRETGNYLSRDDWNELGRAGGEWKAPDGVKLAVDAFRCLREDQHVLALVQAVTALEVCLYSKVQSTYQSHSQAEKAASAWLKGSGSGLRSQLAAAFLLRPELRHDVESAILAVDLRNRVVHNGYRPKDTKELAIATEAVLRVIQHLAGTDLRKLCRPGVRIFGGDSSNLPLDNWS